MARTNCWEHKACGREPGGAKAPELGVCPAALASGADGLNHGRNGGRACWAVTGTLCGGKVQGSFASKLVSCVQCDFYMGVRSEEDMGFAPSVQILRALATRSPGPGSPRSAPEELLAGLGEAPTPRSSGT